MADRYPWKLLPRLASEIEHGQKEAARNDFNSLLQIIAASGENNLSLRKLRCAQLVSSCLRGAHSGGAMSDALLKSHLQLLHRLTKLRTWPDVARSMRQYLEKLLRSVKPSQGNRMERVVTHVRQKISTTAGMAQSLAQYATIFGVSEGHLSRSFAAMVGRTFQEELRRVRMETACRLLRETDLKISMVASQVGLLDPSRFIANFRAELGVTPGEYRKRRQNRI